MKHIFKAKIALTCMFHQLSENRQNFSFFISFIVYLYVGLLHIGNYYIYLIGYNNININTSNTSHILVDSIINFINTHPDIIIFILMGIFVLLFIYLLLRKYWTNVVSFLVLFTQSMSLPTIYMPRNILFMLLVLVSLSLSWLFSSQFIYIIKEYFTIESTSFNIILKVLVVCSILTSTYFKFNIIARFFNGFIKGIPFFLEEFSSVRTSKRGLLMKQCSIYYIVTLFFLFLSFNVILRIDNTLMGYDSTLAQLSFIYTSLFSSISGLLFILYSYNKPYGFNYKQYPNIIMLLQFSLTLLPILFVLHYISSSISISNKVSDILLKLVYKCFHVIECQPDFDKLGSQTVNVSDNNITNQGGSIITTPEASASLSNTSTSTNNSVLSYPQLQAKVVMNLDQSVILNTANINLISVTPQPSSNFSNSADIISRPGSSASVNSFDSNKTIETIRPKRRGSFACDKTTFITIFDKQLGIKWFDKIIINFNTLGFFTNYNFLYDIYFDNKISPSHFNYFTEDLIRRALIRENNPSGSALELLLSLNDTNKYYNLRSHLKNVWIYLNGSYSSYNYDLKKTYVFKCYDIIELYKEIINEVNKNILPDEKRFFEETRFNLLSKYSYLLKFRKTSNVSDIVSRIIENHLINSIPFGDCKPEILYFHKISDPKYGFVNCFTITNNMDSTHQYLCDNLHKLSDHTHTKSRDLERALSRILENMYNQMLNVNIVDEEIVNELNRFYKLFDNPNYIKAYDDLYNLIADSTTGDNYHRNQILEIWDGYLKKYYDLLELNNILLDHISDNYTIEGLDTTLEQNRISKSPADQVLFRIRYKQVISSGKEIITQNYLNSHLSEVNSKLVLKYFPDITFYTPDTDNIDDDIDNDIDDITGIGNIFTDIKGKGKAVVSPKSINTDIYINKPLPPLPDTNNNSN